MPGYTWSVVCAYCLMHYLLYYSPSITGDDNTINITNGRHPIIELLLSKESRYVANDTMMSVSTCSV